MAYHVPTPPPRANSGNSFFTPFRPSCLSGDSGGPVVSMSNGTMSKFAPCSYSRTPWTQSQLQRFAGSKKHIDLSLRGRVVLHRASLKRSAGLDGIPTAFHPLHGLRELGRLINTDNTLWPIASVLEELTLSDNHIARVHDIEGRMLSVHNKMLKASSFVSSIRAANEGVKDDGSFFINFIGSNPEDGEVVENGFFAPWRKYSTAVMLYIALADAGFCDQSLPFLSIQWISWHRLLKDQLHLRLDLMCSSSIRRESILREIRSNNSRREEGDTAAYNSDGNETCIPVSVILPLETKGTLHRPLLYSSEWPPSISTKPFSDVEVFQLFYIQLIFRAAYDIRFSGMMVNGTFLRSDLIAVQSSGSQPLAFQSPVNPDRWLFFPPYSKILCFFALEKAVMPHYASALSLKETEVQKLFGASPSLPCIGKLGRAVVCDWAVNKTFHSSKEALILLEELFSLFDSAYGVHRLTVWRSQVAPRLYHCGESAFGKLRKDSSDITKFVTAASLSPNSRLELLLSVPPITIEPSPAAVPSVLERTIVPDEDHVVKLWQKYMNDEGVRLFFRSTDHIEIKELIGRGGSGSVFKGVYGSERHVVAVKCFTIPDGMSHELYLKECFTTVAFAVLFNQLERFGIAPVASLYDFVISSTPPRGMTEEDVRKCCNGADPAVTPLCYTASKLMDGTLGRFLTEDEDDYDPCFDTLINSPLSDGEFFQFLYTQLVLRALFDYTVFDLMLYGQLRGDNIGYKNIQSNGSRVCRGLIAVFQDTVGGTVQYLRFPTTQSDSGTLNSFRSICVIDLGQGTQPAVEELNQRGLIGELGPDSCVQDDGLGRYWPRENVYAKYIETSGAVAKDAARWGAGLHLTSPAAAESALRELFELYAPTYGVDAPTAKELEEHLIMAWTPTNVAGLKKVYVYRKAD